MIIEIRTTTNLQKCVFARHNYYEICTYIERTTSECSKIKYNEQRQNQERKKDFVQKINYTLTHYYWPFSCHANVCVVLLTTTAGSSACVPLLFIIHLHTLYFYWVWELSFTQVNFTRGELNYFRRISNLCVPLLKLFTVMSTVLSCCRFYSVAIIFMPKLWIA